LGGSRGVVKEKQDLAKEDSVYIASEYGKKKEESKGRSKKRHAAVSKCRQKVSA